MIRTLIHILVISAFTAPLPAKKMVVLVYPFVNTGAGEYSWVSAGMTDTVVSDLNTLKDIYVISEADRKSAVKEIELGQTGLFDEKAVARAGTLAGADLIFTGSYMVRDGKIRVHAKLINVATGVLEKSVKIDGTMDGIFDVQDRVVLELMSGTEKAAIRNVAKVSISGEEKENIKNKPRPGLDAYEWYARGMETRDLDPGKGLEYFKKAFSVDPTYAAAYIKAGYLEGSEFNRYAVAMEHLKTAEKILIAQNRREHSEYAFLLMNFGIVCTVKRDLPAALEYYTRSKELYTRLGLTVKNRYTGLLMNIGSFYMIIGDMELSLKYYDESKSIMERIGLRNTFVYAKLLMNMGAVYQKKGSADEAVRNFELSRRILEALELTGTGSYASLLVNIGVHMMERGDRDGALDFYARAKKISEGLKLENTNEYASILMNIAIIHSMNKNHDEAIALYLRSKQIRDGLGLGKTRDYATLLMNLGTNYRSKGNRTKAMEHYKQSDSLFRELGMTGNISYGNLMLNTASLYLDAGDKNMAGKLFRRAYDVYTKAGYTGRNRDLALKYAKMYGH